MLVMAGGIVTSAARRGVAILRWTASTTPSISACTAPRSHGGRRLILTRRADLFAAVPRLI